MKNSSDVKGGFHLYICSFNVYWNWLVFCWHQISLRYDTGELWLNLLYLDSFVGGSLLTAGIYIYWMVSWPTSIVTSLSISQCFNSVWTSFYLIELDVESVVIRYTLDTHRTTPTPLHHIRTLDHATHHYNNVTSSPIPPNNNKQQQQTN